jgi:hypothetical protein
MTDDPTTARAQRAQAVASGADVRGALGRQAVQQNSEK